MKFDEFNERLADILSMDQKQVDKLIPDFTYDRIKDTNYDSAAVAYQLVVGLESDPSKHTNMVRELVHKFRADLITEVVLDEELGKNRYAILAKKDDIEGPQYRITGKANVGGVDKILLIGVEHDERKVLSFEHLKKNYIIVGFEN